MTRFLLRGPRSLILTMTDLPVLGQMTLTLHPNGRVLWAAVKSCLSNRSPLAVRLFWNLRPYQEANPCHSESFSEEEVVEEFAESSFWSLKAWCAQAFKNKKETMTTNEIGFFI